MKKVKPKMAFTADLVNETGVNFRKHRDHEKWVSRKAGRDRGIETLRLIMKDGKIY
ncbi:MAG: hypothetical protein KC572_04775 [Gammaproteobacteria bacterium]|nr:hypothetical protein [Gammaproteobacteria bacterium]